MGRAQRGLVLSWSKTLSWTCVIDFMALKSGSETLEADAVDSCDQAVPHEEVVVELAGTSVSGTTLWSCERHERRVWIETTAVAEETGRAELGGTLGRDGVLADVFLCSLIERVSHLRSWVNSVTRYPVVVAFVRNLSNSHQWLVHRCQRT